MKPILQRVRKLEICFGTTLTATSKGFPSAGEMVIERLTAGDWQNALELLETQRRNPEADRIPTVRFRDLTRLREKLTTSLDGLQPELRLRIAQQLLAADMAGNLQDTP